jgi:hypothetical protein
VRSFFCCNAETSSAAGNDLPEHQHIKDELEKKSAILATVNRALNTFLDSGDWSGASRHLPAPRQAVRIHFA